MTTRLRQNAFGTDDRRIPHRTTGVDSVVEIANERVKWLRP